MQRPGSVLAFICSLGCILLSAHASHNVCKRDCVEGVAMHCEYNFTVEWYRTLSKACYNCPFNEADCYRPHCVAADGVERVILTINRQMPGPSIEVCEGDTVIVWVQNMMEDGTSVSIHWHGIHQHDTPYMDGVPRVTQCDINYKELFRYEFKAHPAGTHWYHSHTGLQRADGLFGPIIVRQPRYIDPNCHLYEHDLSEHVVLVMDWLPIATLFNYLNVVHKSFDHAASVSGLINGRAKSHRVENRLGVVDPSIAYEYTPRHRFYVESDTTYRFRVMNTGGMCPFKIAIDDHTFIVIALDGQAIQPITVESFIIHAGERVDVVLDTSRSVGQYWFRAMGMAICASFTTFAELIYVGSTDDSTEEPSHQDASGKLLNPLRMDFQGVIKNSHGDGNDIDIDQARSASWHQDYSDEVVDERHYIGIEFYLNDNTKYHHPIYYPVKDIPPHLAHANPVMNNITFDSPPIPLLSQPEDVNENWFCNRSTVNGDDCQEDLCLCTHRIVVGLGKVVELVVVHEGEMGLVHPMHLHGFSFRVLGMERVGPPTSRAEVEDMDKRGLLKRNLVNPPFKDTVIIPNGGYGILRFVANNPGIWFFHCHFAPHLAEGQAVLIQVGEQSDLPPIPEKFPRCGGYGYTHKHHDDRQADRHADWHACMEAGRQGCRQACRQAESSEHRGGQSHESRETYRARKTGWFYGRRGWGPRT